MKKFLCIFIALYVTSLDIYAMQSLTEEENMAVNMANLADLLEFQRALEEPYIQKNYHSIIEPLRTYIDINGMRPLIEYRKTLAQSMLKIIEEKLTSPDLDTNKKRELIIDGIIICFSIKRLDNIYGYRLFKHYMIPQVNRVYSGITPPPQINGIIQSLLDTFYLIKGDEDFKNIAAGIWQQLFELKAVTTRLAPL